MATLSTRNQGQKVVLNPTSEGGLTLNLNFAWLDALQGGVIDRIGDTPSDPSEGDLYVLTGTITGLWDFDRATENDLALYYDSKWRYLTPPSGKGGIRLWVQDESNMYTWNGSTWAADAASGGGSLNNIVEDTSPQLGGNLDLNGFQVGDASAADLTKLNETTATSAELNYVDGVTSNIQTQLDSKQSSGNFVEGASVNEGTNTSATGTVASIAQGSNASAGGNQGAFSQGQDVAAGGARGCFAQGRNATSFGPRGSFAQGFLVTNSTLSGYGSFAQGNEVTTRVGMGLSHRVGTQLQQGVVAHFHRGPT